MSSLYLWRKIAKMMGAGTYKEWLTNQWACPDWASVIELISPEGRAVGWRRASACGKIKQKQILHQYEEFSDTVSFVQEIRSKSPDPQPRLRGRGP
jgi:hypothetical protein